MRIDGTGNLIPSHIARAYGVTPNRAVAPRALAHPAISTQQPPRSESASAAQSLIAGRVPGPVAFDGVSVPRPDANVFHLYTRAADKIEAATAVQIGRTIDIKG